MSSRLRRQIRQARALEEVRSSLRAWPTLRLEGASLPARVIGSFPVVYEGEVLARFRVEILLSENFPRVPPLVREIGGQIPQNADHHNPYGFACLFHRAAYWLSSYDKRPFDDFLNGPVRSFFLFQVCKKNGIPWPHGEQAHGALGTVEYFSGKLKLDAEAAEQCIRAVAAGPLTPHAPCPCGGQVKAVRRCHPILLEFSQRVPRDVLVQAVAEFRSTQPAMPEAAAGS